jgi:hypothetical protein
MFDGQRLVYKVAFGAQTFAWKVAFLYKTNLSWCRISQIGTTHGAGFEQKVARNYTGCAQIALK